MYKGVEFQSQIDSFSSVEIAPGCNYHCPACIVSERLHKDRRSAPENLADLLISHLPENTPTFFIGLGEPANYTSQEQIARILENRPDIQKAHIQTNGSFPLIHGLQDFVKEGILSVGLSYDVHHDAGNNQGFPINLQPEYVHAISSAIGRKETVDPNLIEKFPNLDRIMLMPLVNHRAETLYTSWKNLRDTANETKQLYPKQIVFADLPIFIYGDNDSAQMFRKSMSKDTVQQNENWFADKQTSLPIFAPKSLQGGNRFYIDGSVGSPELLHKGWDVIDKYAKPITQLPKVVTGNKHYVA
ncbi:MAG: radical SAM protein [Candidatus Woesearchaeota archaeon]